MDRIATDMAPESDATDMVPESGATDMVPESGAQKIFNGHLAVNRFHTLPNKGAFEEPDPDNPLILPREKYVSIGPKSLMPPQLEPSTTGLSPGDTIDLYNELRDVIATIFIQKLTLPSEVAATAAADADAGKAAAAADADAGNADAGNAAKAAAAKAAAAKAATNPLVVLQGMKSGKLLIQKLFPNLPYHSIYEVCNLVDRLADFAKLYYIPCKNNIPSLTPRQFSIAFILFYMTAKGGVWDQRTNIGFKNENVRLCQICLTSFDKLKELTPVEYSHASQKLAIPLYNRAPDDPFSLTQTIQRNYGGKRKTRRNNRTSKNKKSKKNSKSKRRRSRRLISR